MTEIKTISEIYFYWLVNIWDGWNSGYGMYDGVPVLVDLAEETYVNTGIFDEYTEDDGTVIREERIDRRREFYVYPLSPDQWEREQARNALWEKYVGNHLRVKNGNPYYRIDDPVKHFEQDAESIKDGYKTYQDECANLPNVDNNILEPIAVYRDWLDDNWRLST